MGVDKQRNVNQVIHIKMKLLPALVSTICFYQQILADYNPNGSRNQEAEDVKLTEKQAACLKDPNTHEDCKGSSRGFDSTVKPWHDYFNPRTGEYIVPMFVQTNTYSSDMLPTLWLNLNWAKDHYAEHTQIELRFIDEHERDTMYTQGYISPFYGGACWSYLGNVGNNHWTYQGCPTKMCQPMDIGWCYNIRGSIVHETMHALGWVHEHMRPDRDQYVTVSSRNSANCQKYVQGRLETAGTSYDLDSIMHYPEGACGIRLNPRFRGTRIGQRDRLSNNDIREINRKYPKSGPRN